MRRIIVAMSAAMIIQSLKAQETWSPVTTASPITTNSATIATSSSHISEAPSPVTINPYPGTTAPSPIFADSSSIAFDAGYFGETITRPGAIVAVRKQISKSTDLHHIRVNIAFYNHPGYNNNLLVLPEYLFRKTKRKGRFFELSAGGGWMYQKPDRPIIVYNNGSFTETNRGWSYLAPTIQLAAGKKVQSGALKATAFSAGLRWFGQYPFNGFLMHHFALEGKVTIPAYLFYKRHNRDQLKTTTP